jgi:hypothetical protein
MDNRYDLSKNLTSWQTEMNAYRVSAAFWAEVGSRVNMGSCGGGRCTFGPGMTADQVRLTTMQLLTNPANPYNRFVYVPGAYSGAVTLVQRLQMRLFPSIVR